MTGFDLTIRGGTVASDTEVFRADVGIVGDRIVAVETGLPPGRRDARHRLRGAQWRVRQRLRDCLL